MIKQHANIDFSSYGVEEIAPLALTIINSMTTNADIFATPTVGLDDVTEQVGAYSTILTTPEYPARAAQLETARIVVNQSLRTNGIYVNGIANGDLTILEKSGYPISKPHVPVGDLTAPLSVKVKNGVAPGTFVFDAAVVPHAAGYLIAFAPVSNTGTDPYQWTIRWTKAHKNTFAGFTSGVQYKFAACGVGSSDNLFWTHAGTPLFAQ